ncbi:hypothetical protein K6119_18545 [Paracrocinitomix mangrovi]|uniref:hypothetical protein n=1 Tax=Paracrocinitomix mangrovi TaxID=2862509 RepID=UPI001C8D78A4|nr:hypothetical protein [Paracrocinitomix mangrovi]UKN01727.1 hypothetical protein K6119_18545 [Paracrocinitomix mangrovi]
MYKRCIYLLMIFIPFSVLSQEVEMGESDVLLRRDYSVGLNFNTRGWGLAFDYGWQKNYKYKQTAGFTCTNIRHEKEHKIYGALSNSKGYYLGKLESLVSFRPHYGGKLILFKAKRENGIEVCAKWSVGPSFGLVKPVYLKIEKLGAQAVDEKYDPLIHNSGNISARSSWFKGLGEANVRVGAFGKFGFDFNFSALKSGISGGEFGVMLDYFPGREIEIMYNNENSNFFSALYLQFNIGQKLY